MLQVRPNIYCNKVVTLHAMPPSATTACIWHCLFSSLLRHFDKNKCDSEDYDRRTYVVIATPRATHNLCFEMTTDRHCIEEIRWCICLHLWLDDTSKTCAKRLVLQRFATSSMICELASLRYAVSRHARLIDHIRVWSSDCGQRYAAASVAVRDAYHDTDPWYDVHCRH